MVQQIVRRCFQRSAQLALGPGQRNPSHAIHARSITRSVTFYLQLPNDDANIVGLTMQFGSFRAGGVAEGGRRETSEVKFATVCPTVTNRKPSAESNKSVTHVIGPKCPFSMSSQTIVPQVDMKTPKMAACMKSLRMRLKQKQPLGKSGSIQAVQAPEVHLET